MKIRKKGPKPSARRSPSYFIGYQGTVPSPEELKTWYDLEYGGPLIVRTDEKNSPAAWIAQHGPWTVHAQMPLPGPQANQLATQLAWDHPFIGAVAPGQASPADLPDAVLFAARLARGLTLLTQGTAFDVTTQAYLNPSDWQDRSLACFAIRDHCTAMEGESPDKGRDWFYTLGLSKFGLDELELFQPTGLPSSPATDLLLAVADEVLRKGQNQKVGTPLNVPSAARTVRFIKHRTVTPGGRLLILREVAFE